VKLTRALVRDLDEVVKEIKQLGEHGEEASQKITELEAPCKQKEDVTKKLKEEKAKLEGMIQSHDDLIMEMADEHGLNHMGENDEDDVEEDDDDDGGDAATPPATAPSPIPMSPATALKVIIIEEEENPMEMVPKQEIPEELEIIASEAEPEPP
jgi:chromosome segregation ATPase